MSCQIRRFWNRYWWNFVGNSRQFKKLYTELREISENSQILTDTVNWVASKSFWRNDTKTSFPAENPSNTRSRLEESIENCCLSIRELLSISNYHYSSESTWWSRYRALTINWQNPRMRRIRSRRHAVDKRTNSVVSPTALHQNSAIT